MCSITNQALHCLITFYKYHKAWIGVVGFLQLFPPAYMEDEEMSLGHALVGDHDEEIIMVALVKTTCMQVEIITNHPTKEF